MTIAKLSFSAALLMGFSSISMNAADVDFSYTYGADNYEMIGTGKAEKYDVAIRITDPSFVGSKIKAFSVPFIVSDDISDISVWASKELTLENKVNIPDITSVDATCTDGTISVTFPEMIEITEGGVYVGYSFTVDKKTEETSNPVAVAGEPYEDGLYLHTSRTYLRWKSYAASMGKSSAITVTLDGDFYANALGISSIKEPLATPGEEILLEATINNHGSEPLESIEYTVSCGDNTQTNTITFEPAKQLYFGQSFNVELPYTAPDGLDEYNLTVEITKVNGVENKDAAAKGETLLLVFNEVPVNRPLMEEYTCLGCGYCTRGYAALEAMSSTYPDTFIAISYHNNMQGTDPMMRSNSFPQSISGNPSAAINRGSIIDPYYADDYYSFFGIEPYWQAIQEEFNPTIIKGSAKQSEDGTISVTSDISFVKSVSGSYKVAYSIIANGLQDSSWRQSNYYAGDNPDNYIPEMAQFCKTGTSYVSGLVFNDIYAAGTNFNGVDDSIIKDVKKDVVYSHTYSFGADDGISVTGYDLFRNAQELYAVIIVMDENGKPYNCNKFLVEGHTAGIDDVMADGAEVKTEYFNLNGLKVAEPSNGVFIKVVTKDNGNKSTSKVILK